MPWDFCAVGHGASKNPLGWVFTMNPVIVSRKMHTAPAMARLLGNRIMIALVAGRLMVWIGQLKVVAITVDMVTPNRKPHNVSLRHTSRRFSVLAELCSHFLFRQPMCHSSSGF